MLSELKPLTLFNYLQKVLFPLLFLDETGDIGRHAKFFQAKIRTGFFQIRTLSAANLAHYIPELVMKYLQVDENVQDLRLAGRRIVKDLKKRIDDFIVSYMILKGIYLPSPSQLSHFSWKRFLETPQKVCFKDTKTGYLRHKVKPWGYIDRKIPDDELIICFTPEVGFSCHSVRQVIQDVIRGQRSSLTEKHYPEDFVNRIMKRYPVIVTEERKEYQKEKSLFEGED